ncbi:MAG: alpha-E domain-containing protein [Planctomycetota bacterium]
MLSRVADSLYWIGRRLERAEHAARLVEVNLMLMLDQDPASADHRWARLHDALGGEPLPDADGYACAHALAFDRKRDDSIYGCVAAAREQARQVREHITAEMYEQLNTLYFTVRRTDFDEVWDRQPQAFFRSMRHGAHLFHGITESTLNHGQGYYFLQAGRHLERIGATARLLQTYLCETEPSLRGDTGVQIACAGLLKSCDAFEAYQTTYPEQLTVERVAGFLTLNPDFPRSIRFAVNRLFDAVQTLARLTGSRRADSVVRPVGRIHARLQYGQTEDLHPDRLHAFLQRLLNDAEAVHAANHRAYISYPIEQEVYA